MLLVQSPSLHCRLQRFILIEGQQSNQAIRESGDSEVSNKRANRSHRNYSAFRLQAILTSGVAILFALLVASTVSWLLGDIVTAIDANITNSM